MIKEQKLAYSSPWFATYKAPDVILASTFVDGDDNVINYEKIEKGEL